MTPTRVLIVDDNGVDRERIRRLLGAGFATSEAATAAHALALLEDAEPDCAVVDYRLPDRDGIWLLEQLTARGLPVLMLTGQGDERVAVEAMKRGAQDYLAKSAIEAPSLRRAVHNALEKQRLHVRIEVQQRELEEGVAELARQRAQLEASQRALADRDAELSMILRQLPVLVWTVDEELRYTSVIGQETLAGGTESELRGRKLGFSIADETQRTALIDAHRSALEGRSESFEVVVRERSMQGGAEPLRSASGEICGVIGAALDVTQTRQLEQQLRHSQKMDALGKLAGGVAHDFNNMLTVIFSFTEFAREGLAADAAARADLDEVLGAAQRGAALVRQLLAFSRQQHSEPTVVDVGSVMAGLLTMLPRLLGEDVQVNVGADPGLWATRIDAGALEQIVVNMAVNARDAMPRGGRLSVWARNLALKEKLPVSQRTGLAPGDYVILSISDNGTGIPKEIQDRVFDPFFTTKPVGKGTGLGLATAWGVVQQAGGSISLYSEPCGGTTFKIYLPRHHGTGARPVLSIQPPSSRGGTGRVLVVEDDPHVRALVVRTLDRRGYEVLEASTPEEAEAIVSSSSGIDLVLTDVVMPGLSGPELIARLEPRLANTRVLYMSGHTGAAIEQRWLLGQERELLEKPFTPDALSRRVREVLASPKVPRSAGVPAGPRAPSTPPPRGEG